MELQLLLAHLCLCRVYVQMMWAYLNLFKEEQQPTRSDVNPEERGLVSLPKNYSHVEKNRAAGQSSDGLSDTPGEAETSPSI